MITEEQIVAEVLRREPALDRAGERADRRGQRGRRPRQHHRGPVPARGRRRRRRERRRRRPWSGSEPAPLPEPAAAASAASSRSGRIHGAERPRSAARRAAVATAAAEPRRAAPPRLARTQGRRRPRDPRRRARRFAKPLAALLARGRAGAGRRRRLSGQPAAVLRRHQPQGIVTIYRGLPVRPAGRDPPLRDVLHLRACRRRLVPAPRRKQLLNHQLRSQADAISLVHAAELGSRMSWMPAR